MHLTVESDSRYSLAPPVFDPVKQRHRGCESTKGATVNKKTIETRDQRLACLAREVARKAVTFRLDSESDFYSEIRSIADDLLGETDLSCEEADEAAAALIIRELYIAAGLSTFFIDYPDVPHTPHLKSAKARKNFDAMVLARLDGFDAVSLMELVRDCGGTVRQVRASLSRLTRAGEVLPGPDETFSSIASIDAMLRDAGNQREEMRRLVHQEDESMGYHLTPPGEAAETSH